MPLTLTYPILQTHDNLVLKRDRSVMAYYRIPKHPNTITDDGRKNKHKLTVAQMMKKLQKNQYFEVSLIPKDYLLEEKLKDFSEALADDSRELGEELLLYTVDHLTNEMEIPYQFDWVIGVNLRKQNHGQTIKELALESLTDFFRKNRSGFWSMNMNSLKTGTRTTVQMSLPFTKPLLPYEQKALSDEELFYYQRMQYLRYIPHYKKEVLANRSQFNYHG